MYRAGDVFGLPVNVSQRLTKAAGPGMLLAAAVEPAQLPSTLGGQPRQVTVRGLERPLSAYEIVAVS